jgi:general stress protein 26
MSTQIMSRDEGIKAIKDHLKKIQFCMLTTVDATGRLHSRPMTVQDAEDFDGELWFFTNSHSHNAMDASRVHEVNCAFADPGHNRYLSISGEADVVRDKEEVARRWKPILKAWFPNGVEEPGIALLRVRVSKAEYWDSPASMIAYAIGFAKSQILGRQADIGENKIVHLQ